MSTETTNKKIKIDNGTTFGRTYTDKAIDERLQGLVSTATFTPVKEKANNSLQKPAGLTKTELVGVGTNGQENIEIGDNLTLANGKLSATGGGSGGIKICIVTIDTTNGRYTTNIPLPTDGTTPVYFDLGEMDDGLLPVSYKYKVESDGSHLARCILISMQVILDITLNSDGSIYFTSHSWVIYNHCITLTSTIGTIYFNFYSIEEYPYNIEGLISALKEHYTSISCSGFIKKDGKSIPVAYVAGRGTNVFLHYYNGTEEGNITIDNTFSNTDDTYPIN